MKTVTVQLKNTNAEKILSALVELKLFKIAKTKTPQHDFSQIALPDTIEELEKQIDEAINDANERRIYTTEELKKKFPLWRKQRK